MNHISGNHLCTKEDKLLLAVSGGIDSMVMLHLFSQAGFGVAVAHCNFQLRGAESEADEALVERTCKTLGVTFHSKRFNTAAYAVMNGISIQMGARDLRYHFFHELLENFGYKYIATAHHQNDNLETVLLNIVRGTGIDGLLGIAFKKKKLIRPLLFATREQIAEYAKLHNLDWREDASNQEDYYHRNLIRNQVVPLLRTINPNLLQGFKQTTDRISGIKALSDITLSHFKEEAVRVDKNLISIRKEVLERYEYRAVVLWETIKSYGFSFHDCCEIIKPHQVGRQFFTSFYVLLNERDCYLISKKAVNADVISVIIQEHEKVVELIDRMIEIEEVSKNDFKLLKNTVQAQLDRHKIQFPLLLRSWRPGDEFQPLGMEGTKKISDFLIDNKTPRIEKDRALVVEAGGEVVWVVGMRISERFKVTANTSTILRLTCIMK